MRYESRNDQRGHGWLVTPTGGASALGAGTSPVAPLELGCAAERPPTLLPGLAPAAPSLGVGGTSNEMADFFSAAACWSGTGSGGSSLSRHAHPNPILGSFPLSSAMSFSSCMLNHTRRGCVSALPGHTQMAKGSLARKKISEHACGSLVLLMCESSGRLRSARYTEPSADAAMSRLATPLTNASAVTAAGMRGRMRVWPPKWSSHTSTVPSFSPKPSILPFSDTHDDRMPSGSSHPLLGVVRSAGMGGTAAAAGAGCAAAAAAAPFAPLAPVGGVWGGGMGMGPVLGAPTVVGRLLAGVGLASTLSGALVRYDSASLLQPCQYMYTPRAGLWFRSDLPDLSGRCCCCHTTLHTPMTRLPTSSPRTTATGKCSTSFSAPPDRSGGGASAGLSTDAVS
mmetsp:Transcript_38097/g.96315  ORF Transcript_38097/g.96315 Transcript_38097/m.96315 type:complete len:397 (-) Transcript_38097:709-1899(-)